ncbi:amidohydrolase family protein [candidate division FCPU426 bacterium]|nr:amidohydrolase family protein [candidate division FCPU426 bacterium]
MAPIIDFHVHAFPDFLAAHALAEVTAKGGFQPSFDGTVAGLRKEMQGNGITLSVVQPVATKPAQVHAINRWQAQVNTHPDVKAFGALHPALALDQLEEEIAFLQGQGIRGVKLHSEYQQFYPDEERLEPLYRLLEKNHLLLLLHAGVDLGYASEVKATPARIAQVLRGFPELTVVAAHFGGYLLWDEVEKHLIGRPLYLDTGYCLHEPVSARMLEMIKAHGSRRILFASDAPWGDQGRQLRHLQGSPLSAEEIQDIGGKNAYNLLQAGASIQPA